MLRNTLRFLASPISLSSANPLDAAGLTRDATTGLVHIADLGTFRYFATKLMNDKKFIRHIRKFPPTLRSRIEAAVRISPTADALVTHLSEYLTRRDTPAPVAPTPTTKTAGGLNLSEDQQKAIELAMAGRNMYIAGSAGTGKTITVCEIISRLRALKLEVAVTATTGVASCLVDGFTFHHVFGINAQRGYKMQQVDVVIIDEVSMMPWQLLMRFDRKARQVRKCPGIPFGGIQVIVCGDFLQLGGVPVNHPLYRCALFNDHFEKVKLTTVHRLDPRQVVFARMLGELREGRLPPDIGKVITLIPNTAPSPNIDDATYLFTMNKDVDKCNNDKLNALSGDTFDFQSIAAEVTVEGTWTDTVVIDMGPRIMSIETVRLAVERSVLELLPGHDVLLEGRAVCAFSMDRVDRNTTFVGFRTRVHSSSVVDPKLLQAVQDAMVRALEAQGFAIFRTFPTAEIPLHIIGRMQSLVSKEVMHKPLNLKVGARVMLRWNISQTQVNGSLGTVLGFVPLPYNYEASKNPLIADGIRRYRREMLHEGVTELVYPLVRFENGEEAIVPPIAMPVGGDERENYFSSCLVAVPLQLGYAFTVHKVQGLTLKGRVVIDLVNAFACNHIVYVALSRVRHPDQLIVRGLLQSHITVDKYALKFVKTLVPAIDVDMSKLLPKTMAGVGQKHRPHGRSAKTTNAYQRGSKKMIDIKALLAPPPPPEE